MNGNVALLTLKVAEWAKMMQQQPQEWMSAVFSSTDLGKVMLQLKRVDDPVVFLKEDYTVLQNILLGAIEFLTLVTRCSEGGLPVPKQLYLVCINKIQGIPFTLDGSSKVMSRMEAMVDSLVKRLLGQSSSLDLVSKEIQDILLSVGSSAMFRDVCLQRLAWHIHELAASLKLVVKGRFNPI